MPSGSTTPTNWGELAFVVKFFDPVAMPEFETPRTLFEVATLVVMSIPNAVIELFNNALSSGNATGEFILKPKLPPA